MNRNVKLEINIDIPPYENVYDFVNELNKALDEENEYAKAVIGEERIEVLKEVLKGNDKYISIGDIQKYKKIIGSKENLSTKRTRLIWLLMAGFDCKNRNEIDKKFRTYETYINYDEIKLVKRIDKHGLGEWEVKNISKIRNIIRELYKDAKEASENFKGYDSDEVFDICNYYAEELENLIGEKVPLVQ